MNAPTTTTPQAFVLNGDCLEVLRTMPDQCIDAVVTDPPYGLSKEPDMAEVVRHWCAQELREHVLATLGRVPAGIGFAHEYADALFPEAVYTHGGSGFMGKTWDSFVPGPEVWREVLRVLKPGGHALVFSGTRTYDLTVLAMRIAGFEIRDQLAWMYGSGFPKSLDVSKAIDAAAGAVREVIGPSRVHSRGTAGGYAKITAACAEDADFTAERAMLTAPATPEAAAWSGWGTALKPAQEPIVLARKPLIGTVAANVLAHGTGAINVDGCRIGWRDDADKAAGRPASYPKAHGGFEGQSFAIADRSHRDPVAEQAAGRWPANVIMDEVAAAALDEQSGTRPVSGAARNGRPSQARDNGERVALHGGLHGNGALHNDTGGASRFFYCAKTSRAEREAGLDHLPKRSAGELTDRTDGSDGLKSPRAGAGRTSEGRANTHPTVKPIAIMRWLVRLITPPGGVVLDPYCGSGSTLCAAVQENVSAAIGIELTAEYVPIIEGRVAYWAAQGAQLQADALDKAMRGVFPDMSDAGGSYQ